MSASESYDSDNESVLSYTCICGDCLQCDDIEDGFPHPERECDGCESCKSIPNCKMEMIDEKFAEGDDSIAEKYFKLPADLLRLTALECRNIRKLPDQLPQGLIELNLNACSNLTELPILPDSLQILSFKRTKISSLKNIPKSLEELKCSWTKLEVLQELPNTIKNLEVDHTKLTELPELPNSLIDLSCSRESFTTKTKFPKNLVTLYISGKGDIPVPKFPDSLRELRIADANIIDFPEFPKGLKFLLFSGFSELLDVPIIPETTALHFFLERNYEYVEMRGTTSIDRIRRINQHFESEREKKKKIACKEKCDRIREGLIANYWSPDNIKKWSEFYGLDFMDVQDKME